ncbi:MAG: hypothetical protein KDB03_18130 [Planctomycetales bacterium]|nr:hypothetical protein [Planctomycetales bacterium]
MLQPAVEPGEMLEFEYTLQRVEPQQIDRLEISVVWYTEGKGSEDIGVHHFESVAGPEGLKSGELPLESMLGPRQVVCQLPQGPLSYEGRIIKIRWCARLRLFLRDGREISAEKPFYLGHLTREV